MAKVKIVKERRHSQRLASKIKFDLKTIDKLQKNFYDQRSESEAQVKAADEKIQHLKRVHNSTIDGIKIKYHAALRKQQLVHMQIVCIFRLEGALPPWKEVLATHPHSRWEPTRCSLRRCTTSV